MQNVDGDILRQIREATEFARLDEIRNDICKFIEYTQVDETGKPLVLGKHHREWLEIIWGQIRDIVEPGKWTPPEKTDLVLFAPRNHGKTTIMAAILQYIMGKNPLLRIKYVSRNDDVSRAVVAQVGNNILNNVKVHEVFPNLKPDPAGSWSSTALFVLKVDEEGRPMGLGIKDATLQAYGITSPATGGRADVIVFDDIIGGREAIQEPGRLEKIAKSFRVDWMSIGGKRHIVVGTPWTPSDILAQLSQDELWECWRKPAINKQTGEALWPEGRPIEWLMRKKRQIGDTAFALQYMLEGVKPKDEWWTQAILDKAKDHKTEFGKVPADFEVEGIVIGVDPAASLNNNGSFSCIFCILFDKYRRKVPYRIIRDRQQPRMLAERLVDMVREVDGSLTVEKGNGTVQPVRISMVAVENNATQEAFVDLINLVCENRGIQLKVPMEGVSTTSRSKWGLDIGLPRMSGEFETGKWIIPFGGSKHHRDDGSEWLDPLHECPICSWINEMLNYGESETTTDMIMASWLASAAIDRQVIADLPVFVRKRMVNVTNVNWG